MVRRGSTVYAVDALIERSVVTQYLLSLGTTVSGHFTISILKFSVVVLVSDRFENWYHTDKCLTWALHLFGKIAKCELLYFVESKVDLDETLHHCCINYGEFIYDWTPFSFSSGYRPIFRWSSLRGKLCNWLRLSKTSEPQLAIALNHRIRRWLFDHVERNLFVF